VARGTIEVNLPDIKLRPGDFPLYIVASSKDELINYDVIDANVNLPNSIDQIGQAGKG